MLFRRSTSGSTDGAPPARPDAPLHAQADSDALDALVGVLRAYARFALPTDGRSAEATQAMADQWVRHATLGLPLRGQGPASGTRQWRALAHAFAEHRREESAALDESLRQLRETVWAFIASVHQATTDDRRDDQAVAADLAVLSAALDGGTTDELRQAARGAVSTFGALLAAREERHRRQIAALGERLTELGEQLEAARRASTLDALTGLANRKEFDDFLHRLVELHGFVPTPACLLMIDLDGFKQLNDAHGHQAGDEALRQVARCMARTFLRRCDFVCRYGGDEFAVVLRDTPAASALAKAEQLREAVADIALPGAARRTTLSLSVGVAELAPGEQLDDWLRRADRALYAAKDAGRDRVIQAAGEK